MVRKVLRLMFGRFGRAIGVVLIVAAAWFLWSNWPDRPLRSISISGLQNSKYLDGYVARDGSVMLLAQASGMGTLGPQEWAHSLVRLSDDELLLQPNDLGEYAELSYTKPWLLMFPKGNKLIRIFDYQARQWLTLTAEELQSIYDSHQSEEYSSYERKLISVDENWVMRDHDYQSDELTTIELWLLDRVGLRLRPEFSIETWGGHNHRRSWHIDADGHRWAGFAPHNRGWTVSCLDDGEYCLHEWDISFKRTPWWLCLLTAAGVLFIIFDFRRGCLARPY